MLQRKSPPLINFTLTSQNCLFWVNCCPTCLTGHPNGFGRAIFFADLKRMLGELSLFTHFIWNEQAKLFGGEH